MIGYITVVLLFSVLVLQIYSHRIYKKWINAQDEIIKAQDERIKAQDERIEAYKDLFDSYKENVDASSDLSKAMIEKVDLYSKIVDKLLVMKNEKN